MMLTGSLQKMLIDTHIFLWFQTAKGSLSEREVQLIERAYQNREVFLSSISIWELALKEKVKGLEFHPPLNSWLKKALQEVRVVDMNIAIALESANLPDCEHRDPADLFIIATSRVCDLPLMTHDKKILAYAQKGHIRLA